MVVEFYRLCLDRFGYSAFSYREQTSACLIWLGGKGGRALFSFSAYLLDGRALGLHVSGQAFAGAERLLS